MTRNSVCQLCGDTRDVSVAIVRYRPEFTTGRLFETVPRCRDHRACRERCRDIGDPWPVDDELVLA